MATYHAPPLDRTMERRVDVEDRRDLLTRLSIPIITGIITFLFGFGLGWASGRNDILEKTFVQRGGMIEAPRSDLSVPRSDLSAPLPHNGSNLP